MELLNAKEPLAELVRCKLPVKTSLALVKLVHKLNEFMVPAETVKDGLVKQYGVADGKGGITIAPTIVEDGNTIANPNWPKFADELSELVKMENEIVFQPVTLPDTLEIETAVLMALEKFVKV